MSNSWRSIGAAGVAAALLVVVSNDASAQGSCSANSNFQSPGVVGAAIATFGSRVVAVGRIDLVSRELGVDVLGFRVIPSAGESFQVGDYAVVIDWSRRASAERVLEVRPLASRYVPGASEVFLKSKITGKDASRAQVQVGAVNVDYSRSMLAFGQRGAASDATLIVRGTQPSPGGVVLGNCLSLLEGSLGTGRTEGSLGTGRSNGSLGTGRTEGSLGTGRSNGSLGTGSSAS